MGDLEIINLYVCQPKRGLVVKITTLYGEEGIIHVLVKVNIKRTQISIVKQLYKHIAMYKNYI